MAVSPHNESNDISNDSSDDDSYHAPNNSSTFRPQRYPRPLIDFVRNEWQAHAKFVPHSPSPNSSEWPQWMQLVASLISAPRFRRYMTMCLALLALCLLGWRWVLSPDLAEQASLLQSLDPHSKDVAGGWFGTNALPVLEDLVRIQTLSPSLLPSSSEDPVNYRRLIFIGDVHGCKDELDKLLKKTTFNPSTDHLIFTGDMVNKGPDSPGVIDLARKHSASCVRGNHEDQVLVIRHSMESDAQNYPNPGRPLTENSREGKLAGRLTSDQARWLDACPVILKVGQVPGMGEVVTVHGGLVPSVELGMQDPASVMSMRTINLETHVPSSSGNGKKWAKLFNKDQSLFYARIKDTVPDPVSKLTTVIYGHDAKTGLAIRPYTKGLDSNCVKGGKLSALVVEGGGEQTLVQVKCRDHTA